MAKEQWRQCDCGAITDPDEDHCPSCSSGKNPGLRLVEFTEEEILVLVKQRKVWTKYPDRWWRLLN